MKRFKSLLSLMIAVVAVFMVGFTTVSAANAPQSIVVTNDHDDFNIRPGFPFYTKAAIVNGERRYVFCLDSHKNIADRQSHTLSTGLYSDKTAKVNSVLTKAYSLGLGNGGTHNVNGKSITEKDLYGVTQMVIWDIVHPGDTGVNGDGYVDAYRQWITNNGYQSIFDTLKNANEGSLSYSVELNGDTTMKKEGNFLVSELTVKAVNVPANTTFKVSVSDIVGGSAGVDKNNSGNWNNTQTVVNGDKIKVRMPIVSGTKNYSVKVTIASGSFAAGWSTYFYKSPIANGQNIGLAIPTTSSVNNSVKLEGTYVVPDAPKGPKTKDIDVSKTDATGQNELPGAHIKLYNYDHSLFEEWDSTTETHRVKGLTVDKIYVIEETVAPEGYDKLTTNIFFKVDSDGKVAVCKVAEAINGVCVPMTTAEKLTIRNYPTKVDKKDLDVSKTDATGQNELPGAHMEIYDLDGNLFTDWESTTEAHKVKGLIVDKIYFIRETVAPEGYDKLTTEIYFIVNSDGKAVVCNLEDAKNKGICTKASESEILAIKNYPSKTTTTKVVITKLDVTNGDEIPGAHLQILDENGNVIIEWISTEEPYVIEGLEPGKYILVETLPADDYNVEMIIQGQRTSRYEFEVTENGTTKIDVYNELLVGVPKTGINVSASYVIGGLVMLIGAGTVVVAKKKEII